MARAATGRGVGIALAVGLGLYGVEAAALVIAGTHTWDKALTKVSDYFGTGSGSNPRVRLSFGAEGAIEHQYSLDFRVDPGAPASVPSGRSFVLHPSLVNESASMTGTQALHFSSSLDFRFATWVGDVDFSVGLPDLSPLGYSLVGSGDRALDTSTTGWVADGTAGLGSVSGQSQVPAWSAKGDLLDLLGFPTPGVSLEAGLGIDIRRIDAVALTYYDFQGGDNLVATGNPGDAYAFSDDLTLDFELTFVSQFYYVGSLALDLTGRLVPDTAIVSRALDAWFVGQLAETVSYSLPLTVAGDVPIGPCGSCDLLHPVGPRFDFVIRRTGGPALASTQPVLDVQIVPEPRSLALVGIGLAGVCCARRRRRGEPTASRGALRPGGA